MTIQLGAGWSYQPNDGGVTLSNPAGQSVYFQPGDDASRFYADLESVPWWDGEDSANILDSIWGDHF